MTAYRVSWWVVAGVFAVTGFVATALSGSLPETVAVAALLAGCGAAMVLAWRPDGGASHLVVKAALWCGLPVLAAPGLAKLLGPRGVTMSMAVLLAASPLLVAPVVRRYRRWQAAVVADPGLDADQALRAEWIRSTARLEHADVRERLVLAEIRAQSLEDIVTRNDGLVPEYVWDHLTRRAPGRGPGDSWSGDSSSARDG